MPRRSAGLMLYRHVPDGVEVLVAHPGGPFFAHKDAGAWSIPKGELDIDEDERDAAAREFAEETGLPVPPGEWLDLGEVIQRNRKVVRGFAVQGDPDLSRFVSNLCTSPWVRSGPFPEIDRVEWMDPVRAREALNPAQAEFVPRLLRALA